MTDKFIYYTLYNAEIETVPYTYLFILLFIFFQNFITFFFFCFIKSEVEGFESRTLDY